MLQINNQKQNIDRYQEKHQSKYQEQATLNKYYDCIQNIQQLYDECEFQACLEIINKVLCDFLSNNQNPNHKILKSISYDQALVVPSFSFSLKLGNFCLPQQIEDIIVKKGYCLLKLKQYSCLENKILNRYSQIKRIQRLKLIYLFETKNFYKVLEILKTNTSNNIENQKMRVHSLFELNRYQECLQALKPLKMHMKHCINLSYIQSQCLKYTGQTKEFIVLAKKLIEEEKLSSNFIRKLLKGVLNFYLQEINPLNIVDMHSYCALFSKTHKKYLNNSKKYKKYYEMYNTFVQKIKDSFDQINENKFQGCYLQKLEAENLKKCYVCLGDFPVSFSICKNYCEFICFSCILFVSVKCQKCMICKTPYY